MRVGVGVRVRVRIRVGVEVRVRLELRARSVALLAAHVYRGVGSEAHAALDGLAGGSR